jgi:predicted dehydrogenase
MIHDIDLVLALVKAPVRTVDSFGISIFGRHEDVVSARLIFANGAIAEITASRASPTAARTLQMWSPEGFAEADFAARKLTWVRPSEEVRRFGLDPARLDPVARARIRDELFTRHLELMTIDGKVQDQLTCELNDFVTSVQTGATPRVTGRDGLNAVAVAERILASLQQYSWQNPPLAA